MRYMVMECHPGYAVVLDEKGDFLKVANLHYEEGQVVTKVVEMSVPKSRNKKISIWICGLAAAFVCLVLTISSVLHVGQVKCASVYMTINPQVRIDVNKNDKVVGLDGINGDGEKLLEGYTFDGKSLELVLDELVDKAIVMGYLYEGKQISLVLDSDNDKWIEEHSTELDIQLNEHLRGRMAVTIEVIDKASQCDESNITDESDTKDTGLHNNANPTDNTQINENEPAYSFDNKEFDDGSEDDDVDADTEEDDDSDGDDIEESEEDDASNGDDADEDEPEESDDSEDDDEDEPEEDDDSEDNDEDEPEEDDDSDEDD